MIYVEHYPVCGNWLSSDKIDEQEYSTTFQKHTCLSRGDRYRKEEINII